MALFGVLPHLQTWSPILTFVALVAITAVMAAAAQAVIALLPREDTIYLDPAWDTALEDITTPV